MTAASLFDRFVHLGGGARATAPPRFGGMAWYEAYTERTAADGIEGRLVSLYEFAESWDMWEMHPAGDELIVCTAGSITLHQQHDDGRIETLVLGTGDYAINPPGVWHTADVADNATALFVTPGLGTRHRPR